MSIHKRDLFLSQDTLKSKEKLKGKLTQLYLYGVLVTAWSLLVWWTFAKLYTFHDTSNDGMFD